MRIPISPSGRRPAAGLALLCLLGAASCDGGPTEPTTPAPEITTSTLPNATVGEAYSEGITVTGGNGEYSWTRVSGSLPPGLELSVDDLPPNDALITGIPSSEGTYSFQLSVRDGHGRTDTASLQITVLPPPEPLAVETLRLPPTLAGWPFGVHLDATGGDGESYAWSVVEGSLPQGLQLTPEGRFQGEPAAAGTTTFTVEVSSGGLTARREFTLTVVDERPNSFTITPFPVVDVAPALRANLEEAIRRWEAAITGDLQSGTLPAGDDAFFESGDCGGFGVLANGTAIDDILLLVNIDSIDGVGDDDGNVLGQAGPCGIRTDTTPFIGILTLDEFDLLSISNEELVTDLIQHEIAHVLGFGTLWNIFDRELVVGAAGDSLNNPRYVGEAALAAYQAVVDTATAIPVENEGGEGTVDGHWRERVFDAELMTGFVERPGIDNFLSEMTIASFSDLGYQVDRSAADSAPLLGLLDGSFYAAEHDGSNRPWGHDIVGGVGPIVIWHPDGTHSILPDSESRIP